MLHPVPTFKKTFFLDLAKSGRSGQYLAGTGSEKNDRIDRNRISGRTLIQIKKRIITISKLLFNLYYVKTYRDRFYFFLLSSSD